MHPPIVHLARFAIAAALAGSLSGAARAVEVTSPEGELYAFPSLEDDSGRAIADSVLRQWFEGGRLHVRIEHERTDGRRIVERTRFRQGRELEQEWWSIEERRGGRVVRAFEVDLLRGRATGRKAKDDGGEDSWDEEVKVERGRTFVGTGVPYAVKNLRDELVRGERVGLRAVIFTPKPRSVAIVVKHAGRERISMAQHEIDADKFEVRPDLKGLQEILGRLKDPLGADVWLHHGTPPMLLRIRYPIIEVRDEVVRIETLGGKYARPPARAARRGDRH